MYVRMSQLGVTGELFDHGVDSLSTVFMPVAIFSAFGRDHVHGGGTVEMHVITWCIFFTFALSHWEKYNTQVSTVFASYFTRKFTNKKQKFDVQ